ncbi:putative nucleotidyltransferase substrate binding domain-containing protein [Rhodoferax sp. PAMC 29310]|uniref:putative nucleotidyltransferase substrate binding domain-containing protein n=1 Tax=Rhodoferax sp. PAMC 29310 TaxID=2822760 RepID=UPI001B3196FD|nr:putative nucleotidyltransferase substrate binding domain-containing protein [Rhodoferax sp. PAMC 29310]
MPTPAPTPASFADSLAQHRVWRHVEPSSLKGLASRFTIESFAVGATLLVQGGLVNRVGWLIRGDVSLKDPDLGLSLGLQSGELLGFGATPNHQLSNWQAVAVTDCQVAWLAPEVLIDLCERQPELLVFFPSVPPRKTSLESSSDEAESGAPLNLLSTPIRTLIKREPITLAPNVTIRAAAEMMRDLRVSSILLVEQGQLFGLITDRDLRNRVVAQGLDSQRPVADIATLAPLTVSASSPAFDALLLMARHNIHHVPVMDGARIAGMITATDLTEQHSTSAVYLAGDIYKKTTLDGLAHISTKVKHLQQHLAAADASAYSTGHIVTAITDALTVRLIQLAETQFGPAPIDYVWVAAGSQARNEQSAKSDQDNCLILDDTYDETIHGEYFKTFSKFVCDGLAACGYIHCPGEMMAMTDTWRQPRQRWAQYFHKWVNQPEPKALMLTCVFFDLRAIHGQSDLLDGLRRDVLQRTKGNSLFLAYMVGNALKHRPPLGMFGSISLIRGGEHPGTIDLKHSGIVPIVDLARVYALADGLAAVNTSDRLEAAAQAGEVSAQSARDLQGALEFLAKLRIAHQARQIQTGQPPDNHLSLNELSNFERSHLKNAFSVVQTLQEVLEQRYQSGRF